MRGLLISGSVNSVNGLVGAITLPSTSTVVLHVAKGNGNDTTGNGSVLKPFATIQQAINVATAIPSTANTPVIIKVSPHTTNAGYSENLTISQQGISIVSEGYPYRTDAVQLNGTVTINLSGTAGGGNFVANLNNCNIHGILINAGASPAITFSGSAFQRLFLSNCFIQSADNNAIVVNNTGITGSTRSTVTVRDCDITNNSAGSATVSVLAGRIFLAGANPTISNATAAGTGLSITGANTTFTANNTEIDNALTINNATATVTLTNTSITGANATAMISIPAGTLTMGACSIVNSVSTGSGIVNTAGTVTIVTTLYNIGAGIGAYVIKGTGVVAHALNAFANNTKYQNTLTLVPLAVAPTIVA